MEIAKIDKKESDLIYIQPKKIIRRNQVGYELIIRYLIIYSITLC